MTKCKVLILNYNGEEHLAKFLPSVVAHTPSDVGVVVADNGSTDNSLELLQRDFPTVEVIVMDRNWGFAEGYNRAVQQVETEYLVLLNSDVEVTTGWVEPLIELLDANPSVGAVAPKLRSYCEPSKFEYAGAAGGYIDVLGYPFCRGRILKELEQDEGQYDQPTKLFWVSGAAFCCRRSLFCELGGFDSDYFAHMEEIDLCWRMQLRGYDVMVEPRSVVYHLGGGTLAVDSPRKVMLNHRNNLAMLFKCAPTWQRVLVAVVRPPLDLLAALSYLLQRRGDNAKAVFSAWRQFVAWHSMLSRKRREIQSAKIADGDTYIYKGSILLRYALGRKHFGKMM